MNGNKEILLTDSQSLLLDRESMNESPLSEECYMGMAAEAIFERYHREFSDHSILVLSGSGNNGGDGIALSILFANRGFPVQLFYKSGNHSGAYRKFLSLSELQNFPISDLNSFLSFPGENKPLLILDCLLGTGLSGPPRAEILEIIFHLNRLKSNFSSITILSVDTPSGYSPDSDSPHVRSDILAEVGSRKLNNAFFLLNKITHSFHPIGFPVERFDKKHNTKTYIIERIASKQYKKILKKKIDSHKYSSGSSLFIGGSTGMSGAILLSCRAFHSLGGGISKIFTPSPESSIQLTKEERSFMVESFHASLPPDKFFTKANAIVIGPGLRQEEIPQNFQEILDKKIPAIIDAGAIHATRDWKLHEKTILTPHAGELSSLAGKKFNSIEEEIDFIRSFSIDKFTYLLAKGPMNILGTPRGEVYLIPSPETKLSTMGSGDILTGILAAFISKTDDMTEAVLLSISLHTNLKKLKKEFPIASDILEFMEGEYSA